jgi:hypothetical protein
MVDSAPAASIGHWLREPLTALAIPGAAFADRLGADVMVGAETGGVPSLTGHVAGR